MYEGIVMTKMYITLIKTRLVLNVFESDTFRIYDFIQHQEKKTLWQVE